jgi:DNA polymerase-3 subunit beta
MKLSTDRDTLLRALDAALGAVAKRDAIPILTYCVLASELGGGVVRACDTEMEITAFFETEQREPGRVAVPARVLHSIIKTLPAKASVSLSLGESRKKLPTFKIVSGRSRFELAVLEADDLPSMEMPGKLPTPFEMPSMDLAAMLRGVQHACSNDETRYYLGGVYLHYCVKDNRLKAVATNGHILGLHSADPPLQCEKMPGIILPRRTVAQILKMLPDSIESVRIAPAERSVHFVFPNDWELQAKLIDGTYPDYPRVIPGDNPHVAKLSAAALDQVVDRVATICEGDSQQVVLCLIPDKGITVTANRRGLDSARDELAAEITGAKAAIGLNPRYLASVLGSLAGADIEIRYNSAADPVLIRLAGNDEILHVIMPIRADAVLGMEEAA